MQKTDRHRWQMKNRVIPIRDRTKEGVPASVQVGGEGGGISNCHSVTNRGTLVLSLIPIMVEGQLIVLRFHILLGYSSGKVIANGLREWKSDSKWAKG